MPYEGEFAGYRSLQRIVETERVQQLLRKARVFTPGTTCSSQLVPKTPPAFIGRLPAFVVAIDGSNAEVNVKNGYPGAKIGYCTVASVLLNVKEMDRLDENRPVDPMEFRKTEEASTIDAALPGSNVVTRSHKVARDSFREALYEIFDDIVVDEDDKASLLDTYEALLALRPQAAGGQLCPYDYDGCQQHLVVAAGINSCACPKKYPVYSTDALRIHERFHDFGTNGEAHGEVRQVWERVLLMHLLRGFERRGLLGQMAKIAFVLDGPLAVFGHPAWLSAAIKAELKRINRIVRKESGQDLLLLGIEKSGTFVIHFDEIDVTETPGQLRFPPQSYMLLTDTYIKERVIFSDSPKRYGQDTYFGRKFFYKTQSGAKIVATLPFLDNTQDTLASDDVTPYPQFGLLCALLDKLASSRFPNSVSPLISAHAQAAIPLTLGTKVLEQLARVLVKQD